MRIIARKTLRLFWEKPRYADAQQPLKAWFREVQRADWANSAQVKNAFAAASVVGDERIVFNIPGNKYRLVVRMNYAYRICYVRFIGTDARYDRIDATKV